MLPPGYLCIWLQEHLLSASHEVLCWNVNNNFYHVAGQAAKQQMMPPLLWMSDNHYAHSLISAVLSPTDKDTDLHSGLVDQL